MNGALSHPSLRTRAGRLVLLSSLAALFVSEQSHAQSLEQEFEEGFDLNPIEPTPAGDRFFLVPDGFSDPDAPDGAGPIRGKAFLHYSTAPSLIRTDNDTGEVVEIVQHQLYAHANVTAYLLPWLMFNADMPFAIVQTGEGNLTPSGAVGDLRIGARFGLMGKRSDVFGLSPGIDLWLPTGSTENLTGDTGVRAEPYVSVGGQASVFVYSAKWGVQLRPAVYTGSLEYGTSMTFGAALGLSLFDNVLQVGPELSGQSLMISEADNAFAGTSSPITGALGAKVQIGSFNLGTAFGVGLTESPGTAPRVMLALEYNPIKRKPAPKKETPPKPAQEEPGFVEDPADDPPEVMAPVPAPQRVDSDGDNVPDDEDACPDQLGDPSENPARHGCPYEPPRSAPVKEPVPAPMLVPLDPDADTDGDGIRDTEDSCPRDKGVLQPENDSRNGCPRVKSETPQTSTSTSAPRTSAVGGAAAAPAAANATAGPPTATWVGFRKVAEDSALIYVNLTETVPVATDVSGLRLVYTLKGVRIVSKNNGNPLLAQHFGSVVKNAQMRARGKDVELVIDLAKPATQSSRVVKSSTGATLRVELTLNTK